MPYSGIYGRWGAFDRMGTYDWLIDIEHFSRSAEDYRPLLAARVQASQQNDLETVQQRERNYQMFQGSHYFKTFREYLYWVIPIIDDDYTGEIEQVLSALREVLDADMADPL